MEAFACAEATVTRFGFSTPIAAKAWLATIAIVLALVQITTAARIYGKLALGDFRCAHQEKRVATDQGAEVRGPRDENGVLTLALL